MKRKAYIKKMRALLTDLYLDENVWIDKNGSTIFTKLLESAVL